MHSFTPSISNSKNPSIIFIIVYLARQYPWYFPYFLHSCRYNPTINFFIFSDSKTNIDFLPPNVQIIPYTLSQFNQDASTTLKLDILVDHGYKLCDFKPAYGHIFSDLVHGYDFWGYCDIDIVFGDIRSFVTSYVLKKYDVISARHDYLTGSFALFRNTPYFRKLFTQSKDYKKVYTSSRNFCFDETNYAFKAFEKRIPYNQIQTEIESMTHVVKRLEEEKQLKAYFEFQILEGLAGNMLWHNGVLTYRKEFEVMYYHLIKLKTIYSEVIDTEKSIPDKFRIGKKKIYY